MVWVGNESAQKSDEISGPTLQINSENVKSIPSLASRSYLIPAVDEIKEVNEKRMGTNMVVPGKGLPKGDDPLLKNNLTNYKHQTKAPLISFESASSGSNPTDPTGAIGPNHFISAWNSAFSIYDRNGNQLVAPLSLANIFPGEDLGDPIVLYDNFANRFIITQFSDTPNGILMAICKGPNPITDGWYTYRFNTTTFPDYPKYSIWSDGYYITANKDQSSAATSNVVFVVERSKMLTGQTTAQMIGFPLTGIVTSGFYSPSGFNAIGTTLPPSGNAPIIYLQDDAWSGVSTDHLKIWNINVNWTTPSSSTITASQNISVTPFDNVFDGGSFSNLPQPSGTDIDALQATVMYMTNYRRFPTHNSAILNFVVDLNGNDNLAGVRWYELRQNADGQPWTIYQEGTYSQPNGHSAFCGAMSMDSMGNIGLGYTVVSSTQFPSLRFTGRYASDPLGIMTISEDIIINSTIIDPNNRYGDYAQMTIDPIDDKTFWYTGEYFNSNTRKNRVASYKIAPNFNNDIGVVSINTPVEGTLTNAESVSITIFNYGQNAASNFPVSYQINGGTVVTETFTGTIASAAYGNFTFTTPGNFSTEGQIYIINSYTSLSGDEDNTNNGTTKNVLHRFGKDIGVTAIVSPANGNNLGNETVTVTLKNFGGVAQSNFNVSYVLNSGSPVIETFTGSINPDQSVNFSFATLADLSEYTTHNFTVSSLLTNDAVPGNNSMNKAVTNSSCAAKSNATVLPIGPNAATLTSSTISFTEAHLVSKVTASINLTHTYDADLDIFLQGPNNVQVELSTDNGGSGDNFTNTIFDDDATTLITAGTAPFTGTYKPEGLLSTFNGISMLGNWTLLITDDSNIDGGQLLNWGLNICYNKALGIYDDIVNSSDLIVAETDNNQFYISWSPDNFNEKLIFSVYNMLGQQIVYYNLKNIDGKYVYHLNMSYAPTGVYLVRLGNNDFAKVKRIIVK